jgi:hypothetical protein
MQVRDVLYAVAMKTGALSFALAVVALSVLGCTAPSSGGADVEGAATAESLEEGRANVDGFKDIPNLTDAERAAILARYASIPHQGVREALYEQAILYYDTNIQRLTNKNYLSVVDFRLASGKRRFFVLDMNGGPLTSHVVAHGKNSDPDDTGMATQFSNVDKSNESSLGFYVTGSTYDGDHGESVLLDGLSSTNSNVRLREIVIHSADYVEDGRAKQGRSLGCFAFSIADKPQIVAHLKNGSIIYASN